MKRYEILREQYPETISMDQLYRICGIAKRSAAYLINHGIIPAVDTGRKTWRWRIALEDVIAYLHKRDKVGSLIPRGAVTSRHGKTGKRFCYANLIADGGENDISEYFAYIYSEYPDVLTVTDVAEMTGLSSSRILKFINNGDLKSLEKYPRYMIAKISLLEFVGTSKFIDCKSNSDYFIKVLGGFEIWKTAR